MNERETINRKERSEYKLVLYLRCLFGFTTFIKNFMSGWQSNKAVSLEECKCNPRTSKIISSCMHGGWMMDGWPTDQQL